MNGRWSGLTYEDYLKEREYHEQLVQKAERTRSNSSPESRAACDNMKLIAEMEQEHPEFAARCYEESQASG